MICLCGSRGGSCAFRCFVGPGVNTFRGGPGGRSHVTCGRIDREDCPNRSTPEKVGADTASTTRRRPSVHIQLRERAFTSQPAARREDMISSSSSNLEPPVTRNLDRCSPDAEVSTAVPALSLTASGTTPGATLSRRRFRPHASPCTRGPSLATRSSASWRLTPRHSGTVRHRVSGEGSPQKNPSLPDFDRREATQLCGTRTDMVMRPWLHVAPHM